MNRATSRGRALARRSVRGFAVLWLAPLLACARPPASLPTLDPGTLRPPEEIGADLQWRQRITARWDGNTQGFDAVLSKTGSELLLLGLGPMGRPGFVLRHAGGEVEVDNRLGRPIPFPPRYILLDVQRVFFPWFTDSPADDGRRQTTVGDTVVIEHWAQGRLVRRKFRRHGDPSRAEVVVYYERWESDERAPTRARLVNGRFGYELTIETVQQ